MRHGMPHNQEDDANSLNGGLGASGIDANAVDPRLVVASALNQNVLVLNRFYQAIRIVNVRRAFTMLCKDLAEVIHIEPAADGSQVWTNLDFSSWQELSELR